MAIRRVFLEDKLQNAYASEILLILPEIIQLMCYGCQNMHNYDCIKNQNYKEHNICKMMTKKEQVEFCFLRCLRRLNHTNVLYEYKKTVSLAAEIWLQPLRDKLYLISWLDINQQIIMNKIIDYILD